MFAGDLNPYSPKYSPAHPDNIAVGEQLQTRFRSKQVPQQPPDRLREFVVKVASRCNLACDYCYMYEGPDQSWLQNAEKLAPNAAKQTARRIGDYAAERSLSSVSVSLHGGEPLLMGRKRISQTVDAFRQQIGERSPDTEVRLSMQTNGVLLGGIAGRHTIAMLEEKGVSVGVSLDGDKEANDLHRRNKSGASTYYQVRKGLEALAGRDIFAGILSVIDIRNDPEATYRELASYNPPTIDFLLPYGTWDNLPRGRNPLSADTPYADWLLTAYDTWRNDSTATNIRLFSSIASILQNGGGSTDGIGPFTGTEVVISSDGEYELVDALRAAKDGAVRTDMDVFRHSLVEVEQRMIAGQALGRKALSTVCKVCPYKEQDTCGGGHPATRHSVVNGFDNPSVYCRDLATVIEGVRRSLSTDYATHVGAARFEVFKKEDRRRARARSSIAAYLLPDE